MFTPIYTSIDTTSRSRAGGKVERGDVSRRDRFVSNRSCMIVQALFRNDRWLSLV